MGRITGVLFAAPQAVELKRHWPQLTLAGLALPASAEDAQREAQQHARDREDQPNFPIGVDAARLDQELVDPNSQQKTKDDSQDRRPYGSQLPPPHRDRSPTQIKPNKPTTDTTTDRMPASVARTLSSWTITVR